MDRFQEGVLHSKGLRDCGEDNEGLKLKNERQIHSKHVRHKIGSNKTPHLNA